MWWCTADRDAVTWTDWSPWGPCQQTKEFGYVQIRSRNCTLRSGQYLHSPLPCLLVPNSQGNIETMSCPPLSPLALRLERLVTTTKVDCKNRTMVEIEKILIDDIVLTNLTTATQAGKSKILFHAVVPIFWLFSYNNQHIEMLVVFIYLLT